MALWLIKRVGLMENFTDGLKHVIPLDSVVEPDAGNTHVNGRSLFFQVVPVKKPNRSEAFVAVTRQEIPQVRTLRSLDIQPGAQQPDTW